MKSPSFWFIAPKLALPHLQLSISLLYSLKYLIWSGFWEWFDCGFLPVWIILSQIRVDSRFWNNGPGSQKTWGSVIPPFDEVRMTLLERPNPASWSWAKDVQPGTFYCFHRSSRLRGFNCQNLFLDTFLHTLCCSKHLPFATVSLSKSPLTSSTKHFSSQACDSLSGGVGCLK